MMPRSPVGRILLLVIGCDLLFTWMFAFAYFGLMGVGGGAALRTAFGVTAVASVVKLVAWTALTVTRLRPLAQWPDDDRAPADDALIRRVAVVAYRTPFFVSISYGALTTAMWIAITLVLYGGFAEVVPLGPRSLEAMLLVAVGTACATLVLHFPLAEWVLSPLVGCVSLAALERKIEVPGRGLSLRGRLIAFALAFALSPSMFLSGASYMDNARASVRDHVRRAQLAVSELAAGDPAAVRAEGGRAFTFDAAGAELEELTAPEAARALGDRPVLTRQLAAAAAAGPRGTASHPREGAVAFREQGERRLAVVIPGAADVPSSTVLTIVIFLAMVVIWVPLSGAFIAGATVKPVAQLSEALARVGEGAVVSAPRVPVLHQDEIGRLAVAYNGMLDQLRVLTSRATEVAKGALDVDLELRGELGDAFRGQLTSLRDIVSHIALSATQLAGAAGEMYAAAQEQEQSAHQQSVGIEEVSRTMESLLAAATHVTESTMGVLSKAERTRETTARTADRIAELSAHAGRIGEILEVIREIADRSDLLALNASLEGTRAGEAGRGFALVAGEMRKLAERVTASVSDIKKLVSDVRASVSATVIATEESSKLAEGTTESARHINLVTQQQRSGTEQAGASMRDVASMVTQSLAATQQIRTLAEDLKAQADNLTGLVSKFRLPERRA